MVSINIDFPPAPVAHVQFVKVNCKSTSALIMDSIVVALPIASFIKKPPVDAGGDPSYKELVCTEEDQNNIAYIIQTMADNGKLSLLFKKSELNGIGARINHVHPFKFLGTVFSNENLKACMREIYKDYFKWNGFMDGLGPSLTIQADQGKLGQYLNDFAKETGVTSQELLGYIQSKDWESMVRYLMTH